VLDWVLRNREWLFSGVGVVLALGIIRRIVRRKKPEPSQQQTAGFSSRNIQAGGDINIALYESAPLDARQDRDGFKDGDPELERMSTLTSEMRADLSHPEAQFVREFFVLPNHRVMLGGISKPRFIYYESDHQNLRGMLDVLEERGYVLNVTQGNSALIYQITDKLVRYLRGQ
jgi:hypothetical protein